MKVVGIPTTFHVVHVVSVPQDITPVKPVPEVVVTVSFGEPQHIPDVMDRDIG